ncbi:WD40 repeat domain-containing protein [Limnoglobus roseus]|uniref:WD40 repeat domain-containing protein n=1 Tax=Limnoglobus roseus TaxID=2598579 RepID=A0A5C1ACS8_9BACT|nr:WD40 repeat domain-containing protein [Limnoglobus roseus]QEL14914.1 WD40 repeat domain-containing protein [Limnoglobus roseus]
MRRLLVTAMCLGLFTPLASAQKADDITEGGGLRDPKPTEPFGDPAAGRPLPPGAFARLGSSRMRSRSDYSNGLQFSPNGQRLIVAAGRDDLWWYDPTTGKTLHHHEYPARDIKCGRLFDDGRLVLFHSRNVGDKASYFVMRFDPSTGKVASDDAVNITDVSEAEFDSRATAVAVVWNKTVTVYDAKTGEQRWTRTGGEKLEHAPRFLADGAKLLVPGSLGTTTVHDAKTGEPLLTLASPNGERDKWAASEASPSPDGRFLAASGPHDHVYVWAVASGKVLHRFDKQRKALGFTPDGRRLFLAGPDESASIWNVTTGKRECEFSLPKADKATLSPDGKRIVVVLDDAVLVYDVPASGPPTPSAVTADLPGLPDQLRFDADGTLVGRLRGWNGWAVWKDRKPQTHLLRPVGKGTVVGLAADRRQMLSLLETEASVSGPDGGTAATFTVDVAGSSAHSLAALSADGRTAVAAHNDGLTRFDVPTRTSTLIRSRFKDRGAGTAAVISADGRTAATEGYDSVSDARYVEVYSLTTNRPVREFPIRGPLDRMAISPDGRRLAFAFITNSRQSNLEKNLIVVDPEAGTELLRLGPMAKGEDLRLALSSDGRTVAWHMSSELRIYELLTGQLRARLPAPKDDLHGIALAGDGRTLAAAGPGWPVILWDIAGGVTFHPLSAPPEWEAAWAALAKPDAMSAYHAARRMVLTPVEAAAFLKQKLSPTTPPDPGVLAKWIGKLDAPAFVDRQQAVKELQTFGELAVPELKRTLEATESAEARQRIEKLLTASAKPTPEAVRTIRAMEALEWLGTADAKAIVKALAAGAEGSRQTQEARTALGRMK